MLIKSLIQQKYSAKFKSIMLFGNNEKIKLLSNIILFKLHIALKDRTYSKKALYYDLLPIRMAVNIGEDLIRA